MTKLLLVLVILVIAGCDWPAVAGWAIYGDAHDVPLQGDAGRGEDIFNHGINGAPPCSTCHALVVGGFSLGPVMTGISHRAGERIEGVSVDEYLRQSILEPEVYIVSGYRPIMYPDFAKHLSTQDVSDLIAYLRTL